MHVECYNGHSCYQWTEKANKHQSVPKNTRDGLTSVITLTRACPAWR